MDERKRPPLLIREQLEPLFLSLTDSERGKLLSAMMSYQWHGKQPKLPDKLSGIFEVLRTLADDDTNRYKEKCERNRSNIMAYWEERRK